MIGDDRRVPAGEGGARAILAAGDAQGSDHRRQESDVCGVGTRLVLEKEIIEQIDSAIAHPDRLKAAIMLCMLSESSMKALRVIDTKGFVDAMNERMTVIHRDYDDSLAATISQLREDSKVLEHIEEAEGNLNTLRKEAEEAVNRFEMGLKSIVKANDNKTVNEL